MEIFNKFPMSRIRVPLKRCLSTSAPSSSQNKNPSGSGNITKEIRELKSSYDVLIIGGGHNGLIAAGYLAKGGHSVAVLEKRGVLGGAAVTEEIIPGFKFSRASYLLSLLRPFIIRDLKLKDFGLKFHLREPYSSYTPIREDLWSKNGKGGINKSLLLGSSLTKSCENIAKFSAKDAKAYAEYEGVMGRFVAAVVSLLDHRPPNFSAKGATLISKAKGVAQLLKAGRELRLEDLPLFHQLLTAPAAKILESWFESEPLKATLATDALIGTFSGPYTPSTGYVLLHHIMGGVDGRAGAWAYPEGGMGAVSQAIAASAHQLGVHLFTGAEVDEILYSDGRAVGLLLKNGRTVEGKKGVFSNATPHVTFNKLTPTKEAAALFGQDFMASVNRIDYTSPVTKINVAVSGLPKFVADGGPPNGIGDHHKCTIHLNCESMGALDSSFRCAVGANVPSTRPMIEMVIPSALDPTLTPPNRTGAHVVLLFTQYTPYSPSDGDWATPAYKDAYAQAVFSVVEEYAPGFKGSVLGHEVLSPPDLEAIFGLTGGNIFHGSMGMDQLWWLRPFRTNRCWFPGTPVRGLWLCGSGAHPGGGVMGLPGFLAAQAFNQQQKLY